MNSIVAIGTYSRNASKGIYLFEMDGATGLLRDTGRTAQAENASFLAFHPNGKYLYAVNEVGQVAGEPGGGVSAFKLDEGGLSFLNQRSSRGGGPCHIAVEASGRFVCVANYGGGSVASLPIEEDGSLGQATAFFQHEGEGTNPQRQGEPHAHSVTLDPRNRFAFVCDLGLDEILSYPINTREKKLDAPQVLGTPTRPGSGPRHFAFHPSNQFAYVINELDSTITTFALDAGSGALSETQTISTLPSDFRGQNSTADIHAAPSGRFLYGSNRGHDSIAIFSVDEATGELSLIGHEPTQGRSPRNFSIDPTGNFLLAANQDSDTVVVFRIDAQSGRLHATGQIVQVPAPVCVCFAP